MKEIKNICIPPRRKKKKRNKNNMLETYKNVTKDNDDNEKVFNDSTIELILTIESSILKFIKNMSNNQEN